MPTSFRERIRSGEKLIGPMVCLDSPEVVEILCAAGYDWLFLEAEHAPQSPQSLQRLVMAARDTPCAVRVPDHGELWIKFALDAGAAGVIVPKVCTADQARAIVRCAKYAPMGDRGVGISRAHGYGHAAADYIARANADTAVMVVAEHIEGVNNIEAIVEVEGIDAVLIGPYDLAASMGRMGQVDHPEVVAAIDRVVAAAQRRGVRLGIFGLTPEAVKPRFAQGFTMLVCGVDTLFLGHGARAFCSALRS